MLICYTAFGDVEIMKDMDSEILTFEMIEASNEVNSMCKMSMKFPWPMSNRDLVVKCHLIVDRTNKAIIYLTKSLNIGDKYYETAVPDVANKHVRMDVNIEATML